VLDDVERRRFLVDPAREHPPPLLVGPLHFELKERAGQLLILPGRRCLARLEADDRILQPHRLARLESQVADDPVSLVEKPDHRDPLGHRRDTRLAACRCGLAGSRSRLLLCRIVAPAAGEGERERGESGGRRTHP
jgi:hypothetical protein